MCEGGDPESSNIGIVDSRADITIIGGELFKKVAAVAKLRKKDLKKLYWRLNFLTRKWLNSIP